MSDTCTANPGAATAAPADAPATFWAQCLEQSNQQTRAFLEAVQASGDPHRLQQRWLDALSEGFEGFMRSPAFLEALQRNLKAMTDLKAFQDEIIRTGARQVGAPLAQDITGLYERLHSHEHAVLSRLEAIEARLGAIEARLGAEPEADAPQ